MNRYAAYLGITIEIRVLPVSVGPYAGHEGSFIIFEMPNPYPDVAYVVTLAGSLYVEPPGTEAFVQNVRSVANRDARAGRVRRDDPENRGGTNMNGIARPLPEGPQRRRRKLPA
jgi:Domain of unknown function (DUF5753)